MSIPFQYYQLYPNVNEKVCPIKLLQCIIFFGNKAITFKSKTEATRYMYLRLQNQGSDVVLYTSHNVYYHSNKKYVSKGTHD